MAGLREKVVDDPSYGVSYKNPVLAPVSSAQMPNSLWSNIEKAWKLLFGKKQKEWSEKPYKREYEYQKRYVSPEELKAAQDKLDALMPGVTR